MHVVGDGDLDYDQPVLPDACVDLVSVDGDVAVAGPATRPVTVRLAPGSVTIGVRFLPGAAPPIVGVNAAELRDQDVAVAEVWGRAGATVAARVAEATDWSTGLGLLTGAVSDRLDDAPALDPVGTGLAARLAEPPGQPLRRLADDMALSERQFRRRVEDAVGYSPRTLARIVRFQRFLRAARSSPGRRVDLAGLAAATGYADQAHLTRESRRLGGLPPAALLKWEAQRLGRSA
jgi:AraC-like DNA-binding protein